jgi:hypothetical protein
MSESAISDWQRGGVRYLKLKEIVPEFLKPSPVQKFFVAVRGHGGLFRLINPLSPLQREYVIALTDDELVVLRLRRPGVFRASIARVDYRTSLDEAAVEWRDGIFAVGHVAYHPIAFHNEDAEEVVQLLNKG